MDEQYRESLQRHYRLLMTHITLTDDVIQQMAKEKILPVTMIKDIQVCYQRPYIQYETLENINARTTANEFSVIVL